MSLSVCTVISLKSQWKLAQSHTLSLTQLCRPRLCRATHDVMSEFAHDIHNAGNSASMVDPLGLEPSGTVGLGVELGLELQEQLGLQSGTGVSIRIGAPLEG